jgi:DNA mismatch endonuclease, patch repair protein
MTDVHNKKTRSFNMSRIRSKDTKPEIIVRKYLSSKGFRYRLNVKSLPGTPDIVLSKFKTAIFVHGCFWHGHDNCKFSAVPKTRTDWWLNKIYENKQRDEKKMQSLKNLGWIVIIIWECDIKLNKDFILHKLILTLNRIFSA